MIEQEGNSGIFKHFLVYTLFEVHRKKQKKLQLIMLSY
jgi:hypothetical protein